MASHDLMSRFCEPSIMYGPDEITKRPYSPGFPLKQSATSCGIGPAAGMPRRFGRSPVGFVRLNTIVLAFGVLMPETDCASPFATASKPLITLK